MSSNLITRLRTDTAQVHKDLEAIPVSRLIMSPEITIAGYINYLNKVYTIHRAIEKDVFPVVAPCVADIENRRKTGQIIQDLTTLQAPVPADIAVLDSCFRPTMPFCIGMLYVSEGSTLGGQYILKNVQKVLGEEAAAAAAFLNVYGPRTGSMWKAFTEMLGHYETTLSETEIEEVAGGAVYGFEWTRMMLSE